MTPALAKLSPRTPGVWVRYLDNGAGLWLFISGMLWHRSEGSRFDAWVVGLAMIAVSLLAMRVTTARFVNTVLAFWLFLAALALFPDTGAPRWNDVIVAIVVFALSLIPNAGPDDRPTVFNPPLPGAH
jgi:hypothetical protein